MTAPIFNFFEEAFRIEKIEFMNPIPKHQHACYELFFIGEGEGRFYIDCQSYDIQKNTFFLVSPNRIHGWDYTHNLHAYLIKFDLSLFLNNFLGEHISIFHFDTVTLAEDESSSILNIIAQLYEEYTSSYSFKDISISNLLHILLIYIQRALPAKVSTHMTNSVVSKLDDLMHHNHYQLTTVAYYAKKLKISIKQLNLAIKELTGLHSSDYIRSKTILEAKRLLHYDTLTCNDIADKLGFVDPGYFSRFFKREVGVSPKLFRTATDEKYNIL